MSIKRFIRFIILLGLLSITACSSQRNMVQKGDALILLTDLAEESQSKKFELTEQKVTGIIAEMDSLCNGEIIVSPVDDLTKLEQQVDKTSEFNNVLLKHAQQTNNKRLAIAVREFKFRTLVKTQQRMAEYFENEGIPEAATAENDTLEMVKQESFKKGEVHGKWVFKERVSMMLPFMQANEKFSKEKTRHLLELIDLLSEINDKDQKKRCWIAIDRMVGEIDVQKSESGYRPFQRRPNGIFVQPGVIIKKLKTQFNSETDGEIKSFSAKVIEKLEKNLTASRKGEFWDKVEFSRELNKKLEIEGLNQSKASENFNEASIDGLSATEWFDKGYAETDENLKIEYYSRSIELNPKHAASYNNRGDAYQALGKEDEAFQDFCQAILFNPDFAPAYINRGNISQKWGKHEEAVQDFSRAIELEPKYTLAYNNRGMSYKNLGRYEQALNDFNQALQLEPKFVSAYFNRGDVYRKLGKDREAILDYTRAIELDPNFALAYNNRGLSYDKLTEYKQAIQDYKKAIEIDPDYAQAYYNLGIVYWTLNRWNDVVQAWEKSLELNPDQNYIIQYLPKAKRQARKMR